MSLTDYKIKLLLQHGFKKDHNKYVYKGHIWDLQKIKDTSTDLILANIKYYNGEISLSKLSSLEEQEKKLIQYAEENKEELKKIFKIAK